MAEIIQRYAEDSFRALQVARCMENAGCSVFSISHEPCAHPTMRWIVWGRICSTEVDVDVIDRCIESHLFPTSEGD